MCFLYSLQIFLYFFYFLLSFITFADLSNLIFSASETMFYKSEAIVLNQVKYGDGKLIVNMLTEDVGRVSFIVSLAKTARGKMKRQLFQPLTIINVEFDYRPTADLQHLRDVHFSAVYSSIPFSAGKISIAFFLSEFLSHSTRMMTPDAGLYQFVRSSLLFLDTIDSGFANFHIVFMLRMTQFLGIFPDVGTYDEGCFFDLRDGIFVRFVPSHSDFLPPAEAKVFHNLMRLTFSSMHLFATSRSERNLIAEAIVNYYRLHVPSFSELQSLSVLREL